MQSIIIIIIIIIIIACFYRILLLYIYKEVLFLLSYVIPYIRCSMWYEFTVWYTCRKSSIRK